MFHFHFILVLSLFVFFTLRIILFFFNVLKTLIWRIDRITCVYYIFAELTWILMRGIFSGSTIIPNCFWHNKTLFIFHNTLNSLILYLKTLFRAIPFCLSELIKAIYTQTELSRNFKGALNLDSLENKINYVSNM